MNQMIKARIAKINNGQVPEGYEKTSFGIFPCDWEKDELKHLGEFGKGKGIPGNKMTDEGVPCVGYGDIYMKYNYHFEKAQSFVDIETAKESQLIKKGTLLFTGTGETAEEIGKCVCYNGEEDIYAGGDIITFVANKINPLFLSYQQYLDFALKQKASFGQGHSVVHIQKGNLEKLNCAYPKSEQEQSRIAQILMQWDKTIELQEKLIKSYQKLKKYYLSKMFPKKGSLYPEIRFTGFTEPWEQRKFGEILDYERPDSYIVSNDMYNDTYETPVLTANKGFILGYTNEDRTYNNPCIIFDDFTLDSKYVDFRFMVKSSALKILTAKAGYDLRFVYERLSSSKIENLGHARHYISVVQNIETTMPTYGEQECMASFFKHLDNLISLHQRKLDKYIMLRKVLQQYLLTGIVRV